MRVSLEGGFVALMTDTVLIMLKLRTPIYI